MTQIGESVNVSPISEEEADGLYVLHFQLVDDAGNPIKNVDYKTVKAGTSAEPLHIADNRTSVNGTTTIVSTEKNEEIDFYIVWAKLTINKGFIKR